MTGYQTAMKNVFLTIHVIRILIIVLRIPRILMLLSLSSNERKLPQFDRRYGARTKQNKHGRRSDHPHYRPGALRTDTELLLVLPMTKPGPLATACVHSVLMGLPNDHVLPTREELSDQNPFGTCEWQKSHRHTHFFATEKKSNSLHAPSFLGK